MRFWLWTRGSGRYLRHRWLLLEWERRGRPVPPPHLVKQRVVKCYGKEFSLHTLVETGTYLGEMVNATKSSFSRIVSIELGDDLWEKAQEMFSGYAHVSIIHGDSGLVLQEVLSGIEEPCLFWLDAHNSGGITATGKLETPIVQELRHILNHPVNGHVILIDDARLFVGRDGFPGLADLRNLVALKHPDWIFVVQDDIIRAHG